MQALLTLAVGAVIILLLVLTVQSRSSFELDAEQYAGLHRLRVDRDILRLIDNHLERNRWYRKTGAWLGFLAATAYAAAQPGPSRFPAFPLPQILAGSLVGMACAEAYRIRDLPTRYRSADVAPRSVFDYRTQRAHYTLDVVLVAVVFAGIGAIVAGCRGGAELAPDVLPYVGLALAAVGFEHFLARRIVWRGQPAGDDDLVAADDHVRATALESIRLSALGFVLCMLVLIGAGFANASGAIGYRDSAGMVSRVPEFAESSAIRNGVVEWEARDGTVQRRAGVAIDYGHSRLPWSTIAGIAAIPVFLAAFGCWSRASRAAFDKRVAPL